jgi:hypothetical protein
MSTEKTLVYILMQELFENEFFDLEELKEKYTLTKKQDKLLIEIYEKLYEQGDE